jgi:hypothetical protein
MSDSLLNKEFKSEDVNRIRNIVTKNFTEKTTDIILTQDQIALMPNVKHIELVAFGETKNGPNEERVVFFDDYKLKMKLGLQVEGNQNF